MNINLLNIIRQSVLIIPLLLISCAINPVSGERELMLVSEAQEIEIGKGAAPSLKWDFGGAYHDDKLSLYLSGIVNRIWKISERPHLPVKFYIQNTTVPNAFALPGYVAITRGLLSDMQNEAQFAAVIGHEVGHVMARHTAQRISNITLQQMGLSVGAAMLKDKRGGDALLTIGAIGSGLLLLKYDRSQEIQSDRLGARYMARLGYDPHEASTAHKVLKRSVDDYLKRQGKKRGEDNLISNLLSTHPRTAVRLSEIRSMIDELPPYQLKGDGKFENRFQSATKHIKEINRIYFIYDEAERLYRKKDFNSAEARVQKAIKMNSTQAPFYNLYALIKLQKKEYSEAERLYKKALSIDQGFQPSIYGLGLTAYFRGNYSQAINEFKKSLKLYPGHISTHFGMGKSYFNLKDHSKAVPHLEKVAGVLPKDPEVHGLLGISYENTGKRKLAVREYKYQLKVAPDTELGRHARKRLAVLVPKNQEQQK